MSNVPGAGDVQLDAFREPAPARPRRLKAARELVQALSHGAQIRAQRTYPFPPALTLRRPDGTAIGGVPVREDVLRDQVAQHVVAPVPRGPGTPAAGAGDPAPAAFDVVDFVVTAEGRARLAALVGRRRP